MSYTGDQSMPRSCPSVSGVAGTAWGPLGTGVTPPASPPSGCIGVLPAMVRRLTWSREREEEHLPVGTWKERKGHLQAWGVEGNAGPLLGLLALCALYCHPYSGCFPGPQPCCGQKTMTKPVVFWPLNSTLSYAPRTMGFFLHKTGTRGPVMDL